MVVYFLNNKSENKNELTLMMSEIIKNDNISSNNKVKNILGSIYLIRNNNLFNTNWKPEIVFINYDKEYILLGSINNFAEIQRYLYYTRNCIPIQILHNNGITYNSLTTNYKNNKSDTDHMDKFNAYVTIAKLMIDYKNINLREIINLKYFMNNDKNIDLSNIIKINNISFPFKLLIKDIVLDDINVIDEYVSNYKKNYSSNIKGYDMLENIASSLGLKENMKQLYDETYYNKVDYDNYKKNYGSIYNTNFEKLDDNVSCKKIDDNMSYINNGGYIDKYIKYKKKYMQLINKNYKINTPKEHNINYFNKYIKYKNKYLSVKNNKF